MFVGDRLEPEDQMLTRGHEAKDATGRPHLGVLSHEPNILTEFGLEKRPPRAS